MDDETIYCCMVTSFDYDNTDDSGYADQTTEFYKADTLDELYRELAQAVFWGNYREEPASHNPNFMYKRGTRREFDEILYVTKTESIDTETLKSHSGFLELQEMKRKEDERRVQLAAKAADERSAKLREVEIKQLKLLREKYPNV